MENRTNNHSLMITQQYPAERYNLLVPMQTVAEIAEIHRPVMNAVQISTDPADKEIYLQQKPDGWALTKKALTKLMRAAGIKVIRSAPMLPTKCEKCAAVNRGIGKPVNCGVCPNKDVKHQVVISMPQLTGENVQVVGTKEILYDDATASMTPAQKAEFAKFRSEMCETKALNRALRIAMQIKPTYTKAELAKPFVVAYLVPNLDNPVVRDEAVKSFFGAASELYGVTDKAVTAQRTIVADSENDDDDTGYEPTQPVVIPENVGQPTRAEILPPQEDEEEVSDPTVCQMCGKKLSDGVINYSIRNYGKPYCINCQKKIQNNV